MAATWASVTDLFHQQVVASPASIALSERGREVTYATVAAHVEDLANRIKAAGAPQHAVVALHLPRSAAAITAMLACLESGHPFLPLDPAWPTAHIEAMTRDARPALALTNDGNATPDGAAPVAVTVLEASRRRPRRQPVRPRPVRRSSPTDLAYVIYTSGSSGSPKGVEVTLGGLATYAIAAGRILDLTPRDRVLQFFSPSFDASVEEIFPSLCSGSRLVIAPHDVLGSMSAFEAFLADEGVTAMHLPPSFWHEWAEHRRARDGRSLPLVRHIVLGGESVRVELLDGWALSPERNARILNVYGSTEATTFSTIGQLHPVLPGARGRQVVGRPIDGATIHLLGPDGNPVPQGVAGRAFIGGAGVARGYLGDPARTAERFLPDPFSAEPGARMLATGDYLARLPDGRLEFLGRADDRVKIRGYRVEIAGAEAAIREALGVSDVAVVAVDADASGETRLLAYVTRSQTSATGAKRALAERLPSFLMPAATIALDALPLTPSGKIDRRALAGRAPRDLGARGDATPPRSHLEARVLRVWSEAFGRPVSSIDEDFLDLGGTSITAVRIVGRLEAQLGVEIPAAMLLRGVTVAALSARLRTQSALDGRAHDPIVPATGAPRLATLRALPPAEAERLLTKALA